MSLVPGLPSDLRVSEPGAGGGASNAIVIIEDDAKDTPIKWDDGGRVIEIKHPDGSITVSLDGKPIDDEPEKKDEGWFANLVDKIDAAELSRIADDLLRGIDDDKESRREWIDERAQGIRLLGLKIELPGLQGAADGAPVEGMSRVRHPLLQEAVLRFQANARSELLPTDGPVKIRNDNNNATPQDDSLGNALEMDMNHYLTSVATEYYPDTDRMLLMLGFGGTSFKKVYFCPLRNRPVSESVDADDVIVNNSATDLNNARRITHRSYLRHSVIRRLQILGVYRDIDLSQPLAPDLDAAQEAKKAQQGIQSNTSLRPEDRDYEIYECYCELDIKDFEYKYKGKETGLEVPYRVTLDASSKQILSIVRDYKKSREELPERRTTFVKYTFVPGFGFYDIGLLHILGNTTNAVTAAWRELLDAGMYACFPGFLISKQGARQQTNILRVPPGGSAQVDTGGGKLSDAVMPLPYKEPSQALMALVEDMAQTGMRVGGTSELQVGEGRADAPVGTTLAMIDQATKVLNSVHKRMHAAQAEEFRLLMECFKEHPEAFWQRNKKPAMKWDQKTFLQALEDFDLTPQADPNTASHSQRVMKVQALKMMQAMAPNLYDPIAVEQVALEALGWSNPQQFMAPPSAMQKPPPELLAQQAKTALDQATAQAKTLDAQTKAKKVDAEIKAGLGKTPDAGPAQQVDTPVDVMTAKAKMMDAHTKAREVDVKRGEALLQDATDQDEIRSRLKIETMKVANDVMAKRAELQMQQQQNVQAAHFEREKHGQEMQMRQQEHAAGMQQKSAELGMKSEMHESGLKSKEQTAAIAAKNKAKAASAKPKPKS